MSMRFTAAINKPGYNPYASQTGQPLPNLFGWGNNSGGKLGLGNTTDYSSPKQVGLLTNWSIISANNNALAIKTDGTLWAWGNGTGGQLGLGNQTYYSSPKQVGALTNWSQVFASGVSGFAVKTDGTLWAWGNNSYGQLGLGNTTSYSSPKQVGSLTNWNYVSGNKNTATFALKTNGTLWSWGYNRFGQLGLGNTTNYSSPKQVGSLTNWATLSTGSGNFFAATKTDGTLWVWGYNGNGQLGQGNTTDRSSPVQVGLLTNWLSVCRQDQTIVAIKTDGTMWSWGANDVGQMGLNNVTAYSSPKQIGVLTTWRFASGSDSSGFAIQTDGTLWSWGYNAAGQLGQGNASSYNLRPRQVGAATTWNTVSGGIDGILALG